MNALSPTEDTARWSHFFVGPRDAGGGFQTHCALFTTVTDGKQMWLACVYARACVAVGGRGGGATMMTTTTTMTTRSALTVPWLCSQ
jgi:hypothetical protein